MQTCFKMTLYVCVRARFYLFYSYFYLYHYIIYNKIYNIILIRKFK